MSKHSICDLSNMIFNWIWQNVWINKNCLFSDDLLSNLPASFNKAFCWIRTCLPFSLNRRSRIKMHKIVVPFFNFYIRWWVGPSTSKNHGANFPPPFSFRKIKVFDIIFEKILSPGIGPPKLWFAFYQQWSIGNWHSIPHLKDLDLRIPCMCLVMILLSWMLRICK